MWFIGLFGCGDVGGGGVEENFLVTLTGGVVPEFGGDVIFGPSLRLRQ